MTMIDDEPIVMPVYLVVDASSGAAPYLREVDRALHQIREELRSSPISADIFRVTRLAVDGTAVDGDAPTDPVHLELRESVAGESGFRLDVVLRDLRHRVDADVDLLRASSSRVYRPLVFVLAASPPTPGWEADLAALGAERRRPVLVFLPLSVDADAGLRAVAARDERSTLYGCRISDREGAVRDAADVVRRAFDGSARSVFDRHPRHALPEARSPMSTEARSEQVDRKAQVRAAPRSRPREQSEPRRRATERRLVQIDCVVSGANTIGTFTRNCGTGWVLSRSDLHAAQRDGHLSGLTDMRGPFGVSPEFKGCAQCGNRSFAKCGTCGQLGCWGGSSWHACRRCGARGQVAGSIEQVMAVD